MPAPKDETIGHVILAVVALAAFLFLMAAMIGCSAPQGEEWQVDKIRPTLYFYHTDSCPGCKRDAPFVRELQNSFSHLVDVRPMTTKDAAREEVQAVPYYKIAVSGVERVKTHSLSDAFEWIGVYHGITPN